jgi:metal-sulfur cluster biosynthetic enzyme
MIDQESLLSALRGVKDPELNFNVIDLGLVYPI